MHTGISLDARDWALVPRTPETTALLKGVPGVSLKRGKFEVHRSHFPLLRESYVSAEVEDFSWKPVSQPLEPRPWQPTGAEYIRSRRSTLLGDQQRLGKTYTICLAHDPAEGQLIVVGPLATRPVWAQWFERCFPTRSAGFARGLEYDAKLFENDIVFIHYDILDSVTLGRPLPAMTVFDEGHVLSNKKSARTQAAHRVAGKAKRVVITTGTPAWNRPRSVFPMLNLIAPRAFGSWTDYAVRYCDAHFGEYGLVAGGCSGEEEMKLRLTEVMLRRTWFELQEHAPVTTKDVRVVELPFQAKIDLDIALAQAREASSNSTAAGEYAHLRRLVGEAKVDEAINWVNDHPGEPLVVWVWHNDMGKAIARGLIGSGRVLHLINGKTPPESRELMMDQWKRSPDGILIMSIAIGQAGIDLSHSRRALFAEQDWTPAVLSQAEFRTYSPTRPDFITYLVTDHSLDTKVLRTVLEKAELSRRMGMPASESSFDIFQQAMDTDIPTGSDIVDWLMSGFNL